MSGFIDIVFDGPPSHEAGRFVESEDEHGRGISVGEWVERDDGFWALRIPRGRLADVRDAALQAESILSLLWHRHTPPGVRADQTMSLEVEHALSGLRRLQKIAALDEGSDT